MIPLYRIVELLYIYTYGSRSGRPQSRTTELAPVHLSTLGRYRYYATRQETAEYFLGAFVFPFIFFMWGRWHAYHRLPGTLTGWLIAFALVFVMSSWNQLQHRAGC
ncbi:hypothetical protein ISF_04133 [Cordyceps fumosorosea ARSEF 2679]|uniref:Uncharacterized protein n=1 Tax=Cordyceps fumosorosea (strain ARSEF 2679) TaxID=1081104 RepID=A0A167YGG8_CORFA|nr:hypothetical protein ISF_04133 [Cordyceps fumosorosea ARSEF 2679]OAA66295.1 hypothetical protein ISF_04133 [Cordyceps fumosorosea ARSEF 2679]